MLYIVGTPIGNLDDLSLRQAKTLLSSDIILAEDTRSAGILLDACRLRSQPLITSHQTPKLISYYKEKEFEKLPEVMEFLKDGKNISLISESGMPLISDPGYLLIKTAIKEKITITVIPGPSAITTALICSGFNPHRFMFLGFFPKKQSELLRLINKAKQIKQIFPEMIVVFFESPNRINQTLQYINESSPEFEIVICREMTKKFEEVIRGKAVDLMNRTYKGEITVILK